MFNIKYIILIYLIIFNICVHDFCSLVFLINKMIRCLMFHFSIWLKTVSIYFRDTNNIILPRHDVNGNRVMA